MMPHEISDKILNTLLLIAKYDLYPKEIKQHAKKTVKNNISSLTPKLCQILAQQIKQQSCDTPKPGLLAYLRRETGPHSILFNFGDTGTFKEIIKMLDNRNEEQESGLSDASNISIQRNYIVLHMGCEAKQNKKLI